MGKLLRYLQRAPLGGGKVECIVLEVVGMDGNDGGGGKVECIVLEVGMDGDDEGVGRGTDWCLEGNCSVDCFLGRERALEATERRMVRV